MNSTRPIRALLRGLDALTVLNARDSASAAEIAAEIRLPRTTVYRILETLCDAGFVFKDAADERYRLTILALDLSVGFDEERWISDAAKTPIDDLSKVIVWPVSLSTLNGTHMMIRAATDHRTPLAIERQSAGCRLPLLESAAGRAYVANCPRDHRNALLETLAVARTHLAGELDDIRRRGFAALVRPRRQLDEIALSVPVRLGDSVLSVVTVRFMASAVPLTAGVERFLPLLRQCAAGISHNYLEQQAAACTKRMPATAV